MTLLLWIGGAFVVACIVWKIADSLAAAALTNDPSPEAEAKHDAQQDAIMAGFHRREAAREAREAQDNDHDPR